MLNPIILDRARRLEDAAKQAYAAANAALAENTTRIDSAQTHRQSLFAGGGGFSIAVLRNVESHLQHLEQLRGELALIAEEKRLLWVEEQKKLKGFEKVQEKHEREAAYKAARQAQKQTDEFASRKKPH